MLDGILLVDVSEHLSEKFQGRMTVATTQLSLGAVI